MRLVYFENMNTTAQKNALIGWKPRAWAPNPNGNHGRKPRAIRGPCRTQSPAAMRRKARSLAARKAA